MSSVEFIKNTFGIDNETIMNMINICEGILIIDKDRILQNAKTLIEFGYPKNELGMLFSVNPAVLCYDYKELTAKLKQVIKNNNNLEELLKNNPFLI
ncbi:MAG: hypothetical protein RR140_00555 [Clostridia bacterium]